MYDDWNMVEDEFGNSGVLPQLWNFVTGDCYFLRAQIARKVLVQVFGFYWTQILRFYTVAFRPISPTNF